MIDICIFGDSIVWGANDSEKGGWVERLKMHLIQEKKGYVYNLGVPGDNTEDLLERFEKEVPGREPQFIIFAIGINDSQYSGTRDKSRIRLEQFANNLSLLLGKARRFVSNIVFVGLTQVDEAKTMPRAPLKYYDNTNISIYNLALKQFCEKENLVFVNMWDILSESDLEDGLHPNSQGHQKMFERVRDAILPLPVWNTASV